MRRCYPGRIVSQRHGRRTTQSAHTHLRLLRCGRAGGRVLAAYGEALGDTGRRGRAEARNGLFADIAATRLDAIAMLRRVDRVEGQAPSLFQPGSYLEPFALRALGIVRDDAALLARSRELFATLGVDWHAAQTDALAA